MLKEGVFHPKLPLLRRHPFPHVCKVFWREALPCLLRELVFGQEPCDVPGEPFEKFCLTWHWAWLEKINLTWQNAAHRQKFIEYSSRSMVPHCHLVKYCTTNTSRNGQVKSLDPILFTSSSSFCPLRGATGLCSPKDPAFPLVLIYALILMAHIVCLPTFFVNVA